MKKFNIAIISIVINCAYFSGISFSMEKLDESTVEKIAKEKSSDITKETTQLEQEIVVEIKTSDDLVRLSWEASSKKELERLDELVTQCVTV